MSKKGRDPIVPFPHMEEPNLADEQLDRFFRDMEAYGPEELPEKDGPVWLFVQEALHRAVDLNESMSGCYASDGMEQAHSDLVRALNMARKAFDEEQVGPLSEAIIKDYLQRLEDKWFDVVGVTDAVRRSYQSRVESGYKMGHAAYPPGKSWVTYWDDRWLERRSNGKGWVYSADRILKELPADVVPPSHTTISRYRKKIFQSH